MTPIDWFAATSPDLLLESVNPRWPYPYGNPPPPLAPPIARRLILFGCACVRQVWELLPADAHSAVRIRERFAEGRASEADLRASEVRMIYPAITPRQHAINATSADPIESSRSAAKALATHAIGPAPPGHPTTDAWHEAWNAAFAAVRATQAAYFRDIFPPPNYKPRIDRTWLTSTVTALAKQIDKSGDFSTTPILADALQDAGCEDEAMLECCRVPGNVHVRGNWVVDSVLGRG